MQSSGREVKVIIVMVMAVMMSLTAFAGAAQAAPGVPPGAFVDANRNMIYDAAELQFTTIQAAIDAAPIGGQVVVTPGTYVEQLTIIKSLSLVSDPALAKPIVLCPTTLTGDMAMVVIDGAGNNVLISDLIFEGPGPLVGPFYGGIMVKNDAIADIVGNVFRNIYSPATPGNVDSFAINVGHSRAGGMWISTAQARVYNNIFTACYPGAVSVMGFGSVLNFDTNDVSGHGVGPVFDPLPQWGALVLDEAQAVITYNNFNGLGTTAGGAAILAANGADVDINNNVLAGTAGALDSTTGIYLQGTGVVPGFGPGTLNLINALVDSNDVSGFQTGIYLLMSRQDPIAMTSPPLITNNLIWDNTVIGLDLEAVDNVTVSYNTITGNGLHGVYVSALFNDNLIQDNNIYGNDPSGLGTSGGLHNFTPINVVDAAYNFWGSPTGPGGEWLGLGDGISSGVIYGPWYTAPVVGGSAISAAGSQTTAVVSGGALLNFPSASMDLGLIGSGTYTATAMLFTGAPAQGMVKPMPRYYHFRLDTVAGLSEVTVHAKYLTVPGTMNEDSLRLYYYDIDHWVQFSDTVVDTANRSVIGTIGVTGVSPSLGMLTGEFLIGIGQPGITAVPSQGPAGTTVTVRGGGFSSSSPVEVRFNGALVADGLSDLAGTISPISFTVPALTPGVYEIRATDGQGSYGVTTFNLLDVTPLVIDLSTYAVYYLHEMAQWDFTVYMGGVPTNADVVTVNLVTPTGNVPLTGVTQTLGAGHYRTPYNFVGGAGEYALLIEARVGATHQGDLGRVFNMSATLPDGVVLTSLGGSSATLDINGAARAFQRSSMNFALVEVAGTTASVGSSIGGVTANYATISAAVSSISASTVTITSQVGTVSESAALIHATAVSYSAGLITVQTDIGSIITGWASINASVNDVTGTTARITSSVGEFNTTAASVHAALFRVSGLVADISTDLNVLAEAAAQINATLTDVVGTTVTISSSIGTIDEEASLISAHVTQVQGTHAVVASSLGAITVPAAQVAAQFVGISGTTASLSTSLGNITEAASLINAQVTLVTNVTAMVSSSLDTIQVPAAQVNAALHSVFGANVNITTSLNTVNQLGALVGARATEVNATMTKINSTVGFIWISNAAAGVSLTSIVGPEAIIATGYGTVLESASVVNAHITSLNNWTVVIGTSIGSVTQNVTTINGHLTAFNGTMATVGTDVGSTTVPVAQVRAQVTALSGSSATIGTIFGTMPGTVASTSGSMANITTSIGTVTLDISKYQSAPDNTGLIVLVVLAILAIVVLAFLVTRRKK